MHLSAWQFEKGKPRFQRLLILLVEELWGMARPVLFDSVRMLHQM